MSKRVRAIFGDFQTPIDLAREVTALVLTAGDGFSSVVEPTCGAGSFLLAAAESLGPDAVYFGFDINPLHVEQCQEAIRSVGVNARIEHRDFYETEWRAVFAELPPKILVIGNPPWVTNSALGALGGDNLPAKSNFQGHNGFAAKTGKANFDISEWMLIRLLESLSGRPATLAMLCKTATARKVLRHAWRNGFDLGDCSLHVIDAARHFGVSVDACLLLTHTGHSDGDHRATVYANLSFAQPLQTLGMVNGEMVSDVATYLKLRDLDGIEYRRWRSGVKHDVARVMELEQVAGGYRNGLGETWPLEPDFVYPLLKSSDLANGRLAPRRHVLLTQSRVSDDTAFIETLAPTTWDYLRTHEDAFDARGSSIYDNRPRFAVFGVGPYTFSPWKVAVSALYQDLRFQAIGSLDGKPVVLDDTCYFFPCQSRDEAEFFAGLLNAEVAQRFLCSLIFFDSKRAITIDVLRRIDLLKLAERLGQRERAAAYLVDAPFEQGAQQLLLFEEKEAHRAS
ncbi:MAG TPA: N-6 DNA methylase [Anaerolineae bacterium]|nr:N-6 DNA methylase [Anaerolineae bacterium]